MNHQREICRKCKKKMVFNHYYPMTTREHPYKKGYMCQKCHDNQEAAKGGRCDGNTQTIDSNTIHSSDKPPRKSLIAAKDFEKHSKHFDKIVKEMRVGGR